ncbi:MAG TPA: hypothetical protein EYQ25_07910 [Planctomycetes bacterium]|nr:hypothetical protein [Planctomycetota bacterium]HIL36638.1 hypothetical protein [Planctomycetota bacterium]
MFASSTGQLELHDAVTGERIKGYPAMIKQGYCRTVVSDNLARVLQVTHDQLQLLDGDSFEVLFKSRGTRLGSTCHMDPHGEVLVWLEGGRLHTWTKPQGEVSHQVDLGTNPHIRVVSSGDQAVALVSRKENSEALLLDLAQGKIVARGKVIEQASLVGVDPERDLLLLVNHNQAQSLRLSDLSSVKEYPTDQFAWLDSQSGVLLLGDHEHTRAIDLDSGEELWRRNQRPLRAFDFRLHGDFAQISRGDPDDPNDDAFAWVDQRGLARRLTLRGDGKDTAIWPSVSKPINIGRTLDGLLWCAHADGLLELLDPRTLQMQKNVTLGSGLRLASAGGNRVLCETRTGRALLYDLKDLSPVGDEPCGDGATLSGDGRAVILHGTREFRLGPGRIRPEGSGAHLWIPGTGKLPEDLSLGPVIDAALVGDGSLILLLDQEAQVTMIRRGTISTVSLPPEQRGASLLVEPTGSWVAIGCGSPFGSLNPKVSLLVLDGPELKQRNVLDCPGDFVFGGELRVLRLSPDGKRLAATTGDWAVTYLWRVRDEWALAWSLEEDGGNPSSMLPTFDRSGEYMTLWGMTHGVRLFSVEAGASLLRTCDQSMSHLLPPDGKLPMAAIREALVVLIDPEQGHLLAQRASWSDADARLLFRGGQLVSSGQALSRTLVVTGRGSCRGDLWQPAEK